MIKNCSAVLRVSAPDRKTSQPLNYSRLSSHKQRKQHPAETNGRFV